MANTTVTKVSDMMLTNVTPGVKSGDQKASDAKGFTDVMNIAKDSTARTDGKTADQPDQAKASRTVVETPKSKEIASGEKVRKDPVNNAGDMEELTAAAAEETSAIIEKIKEVLGVSDEELTEAMEILGITAIDLLDPVSIKELCMELTGTADSISLITNADLYGNVKEIIETAEGAAGKMTEMFSLTDEEASKIFEDPEFAKKVNEAVTKLDENAGAQIGTDKAIPETEGAVRHDMDVDNQTDADAVADKDINAAAGTEARAVTAEVKGTPEQKPVSTVDTAENEGSDPTAKPTVGVTETFKAAANIDESELKGNNEGFEHASRFAESEAVAAAPQTTVETSVNNLGEVIETVSRYSNADADSIMSQVTESVRVNYLADTTSMEMQLHPASLGTVNMHIASTNGVVTAHILVENEAVKTALESQLISLQQTFEEQGQKVEAVEVSVANYDLNRGDSSNTDGNAQQHSAERAGRAGARRRINLNDLDEEELESLGEEEKLSADMMARSGNSVDYTA